MIAGPVAGLDIGGTRAKIAIVDSLGGIMAKATVTTGANTEVRVLAREAASRLKSLEKKSVSVSALGVGCPGLIGKGGLVVKSPNLRRFDGENLREVLEEFTGLETVVDNDANCFALAEWEFGSAVGVEDGVFLTIGTGVGGGIVAGGELVTGAHGFAGELGHIPISPTGPRCHCGGRGCLETYVGAEAIVKRTKETLSSSGFSILRGKRLTPRVVWKASEQGDVLARKVVKETGRFLGLGLAFLANALDPAVIVVGGGIGSAPNRLFSSSARRTLSARLMSARQRKIKVLRAALGPEAGVVGASLLARACSRGSRG